MKSSISVVVASLLAGSVAFAGGFESGQFYVGINAGVDNQTIDSSAFDSDSGPWLSTELGRSGFIYGVHAGWRIPFSKSFHGLEISFKDSTSKSGYKINDGKYGGEFETNESYDISYKGGYEFATNTFLTGRVGYGQLKTDYIIKDDIIASGKFKKTLDYFLAGVGIEHYMDDRFSITGEYIYRGADDVKRRHMYTDGSSDYIDVKGDYSDHLFLIGVNYFF